MKYFDWNEQKNDKLKQERDVCFEDIITSIDDGNMLDIIPHPNSKKYPNQSMFVVKIYDYVYLVLFVEDEEKVYLKTIMPSRKATKLYIIKIK